jgi:transposase-like protein
LQSGPYEITQPCAANPQLKATYKDLIDEANQLIAIDYNKIRDERFIKGVYCPHCFQTTGKFISEYISYGFVNGTQWRRYHCKQCERIFSDLTNTMFHRGRNMNKWPMFIKLLMVDRLPIKEIKERLKIHINTAYAWRKKLQMFAEKLLPIQQHPPMNNKATDLTIIQIHTSNKGNTSAIKKETAVPLHKKHKGTIPIFIAAVREAPNQLFANVLHGTEQTLQFDVKPVTSASTIQLIERDFLHFYRKMRGVTTRNLPIYLTWYRMLHLLDAVNPQILADEMFKLCLDKDALSHSRRLIKKLI